MNNTPITGRSSIGDSLSHPMGGLRLRDLLRRLGRTRRFAWSGRPGEGKIV